MSFTQTPLELRTVIGMLPYGGDHQAWWDAELRDHPHWQLAEPTRWTEGTAAPEPEAPATPEVDPEEAARLGRVLVNAPLVAFAEAVHDYIVMGLAMSGQAMRRGWQSHWQDSLLPDMSFICRDYLQVRPPEGGLNRLHTLAILQGIAVDAMRAGTEAQVVAKTALTRAITQAIPHTAGNTVAGVIAQAIISNEPIAPDDRDLYRIHSYFYTPGRQDLDEISTSIRDKFKQAWEESIERLNEHADEHNYCDEYEAALEQIADATLTRGLSYPDRDREIETEVTLTWTVRVRTTVTHPRGTDAADYADTDMNNHSQYDMDVDYNGCEVGE